MVGTRPKNKFKLPQGTCIEISDDESPPSTPPPSPLRNPYQLIVPHPLTPKIEKKILEAMAEEAINPDPESYLPKETDQPEENATAATPEKKQYEPEQVAKEEVAIGGSKKEKESFEAESETEQEVNSDDGKKNRKKPVGTSGGEKKKPKVAEESGSSFAGASTEAVKSPQTRAAAKKVKQEEPETKGKKKKKVDDCSTRKVFVPRALNLEDLKTLGIEGELRNLFAGCDWEQFLDLPCEIYETVVKEVFSSLDWYYDEEGDPAGIEFYLNGQKQEAYLNELNQVLGFATLKEIHRPEFRKASKRVPVDFTKKQWENMWGEISPGQFIYRDNKGSELATPALRIAHRILAYNLYGKGDSGNALSNKELYILYCMKTGMRLNFGAFLVEHLRTTVAKQGRKLSCAQFVTQFVKGLGMEEEMADQEITPAEELNMDRLARMKEVVKKGDRWVLVDHTEKEQKAAAKLPPRRTSARGKQAKLETETEEEEEVGGDMTREQADDLSRRLSKMESLLEELKEGQELLQATMNAMADILKRYSAGTSA